jgi:phthiocerol/phenolphthiocerol synthesis type-I polyketide synthase C
VVLNSLTGERVGRSLSLLRPFGRFLELGKRDYYEHRRMAMAPFRNNLSYHGIDLDQALESRAGFRRNVMSRVLELVSHGVLRPLPFRVFPISRARDAFRHMQMGQHIGKIVIGLDDEDARPEPGEGAPLALRADRSYLITGGLSGLGLETARWMAHRGARHLTLVSRSGPAAPDAVAAVEELRAAGCEVLAASVDVSDEAALRRLLVESSQKMPPLAGVVHSAMTLDDAMIPAMTPERFWRGARAKILGAWNLHRLTLDTPLDFFVLYSSVSATLGVPGQANYAAGNAFLESLAHYRRRMNLAGTAVAWGAISDTGYLVRNPGVRETLENRVGVRSLSSRQAFQYLDQILTRDCPQWIAADFNWSKLSTSSAALLRSPRFAELVEHGTVASSAEDVENLRTALAAMAPGERHKLLIDLLTKELARVLGSAPARLDPHRPLTELGVDSLMAVELLTAIDTRFHAPITSLEIMGGVTIAQLAGSLAAAIQAASADGQETCK